MPEHPDRTPLSPTRISWTARRALAPEAERVGRRSGSWAHWLVTLRSSAGLTTRFSELRLPLLGLPPPHRWAPISCRALSPTSARRSVAIRPQTSPASELEPPQGAALLIYRPRSQISRPMRLFPR